MSGRRSEPAPLPPMRRMVDGVLHVGTHPWFPCDWCGTMWDVAECEQGCPVCAVEIAETLRRHADDLRMWAAEHLMGAQTTKWIQ